MNVEENGPNLVSSSESVVDENPWERLSNPRITSGKRGLEGERVFVEVDMFALVRNFVGHMTIRSLMGADFLEHQPKFLEMLWNFDNGWQYMLLGLPRWLPIPCLPKAYIARRKLAYFMTSFHRAVDGYTTAKTPTQGGNNLDEASQLFKDRSAIWRAHKTAENVRASADLSLLWA